MNLLSGCIVAIWVLTVVVSGLHPRFDGLQEELNNRLNKVGRIFAFVRWLDSFVLVVLVQGGIHVNHVLVDALLNMG